MTDAKARHLAAVKTELAEKYERKSRAAGSDKLRRQFQHRARAHQRKAQSLTDLIAFREREAAAA